MKRKKEESARSHAPGAIGNRHRLVKTAISLAVVLLCCAGIFFWFTYNETEYVEDISEEELQWAYELLAGSLDTVDYKYTDYLMFLDVEDGEGEWMASPEEGQPSSYWQEDETLEIPEYDDALSVTVLDYEDTATYHLNVKKSGVYVLSVDYVSAGDSYLDYTVAVQINGETQYQELNTIDLPLYWEDSVSEYLTDRYGDQIAPTQDRINEWRNTYLYNNTYASVAPLYVTLQAGDNEITLTNMSNDGLALGTLYAEPPADDTLSYDEYLAVLGADTVTPADAMVSINAIDYMEKNSAEIVYESLASMAVTPSNTEYKYLNVLNLTSAGDTISYEIEVEEDGFYALAFHYKNEKEEFNSYESILIDGSVPYRELSCYAFPYTGSGWENETLSGEDGNPYYIYLTAGTHTLTLKAEMEPVTAAWRYGQLIASHVTQFSLNITKIAGTDADEYRTWKMTQYIPEIPDYLAAYSLLIQHIRYLLQYDSDYGTNGAILSYLDKAEKFIDEMAEYPDEIALYTTSLTGADNSVLVAISNFSSSVIEMDFTLDMIYLYGGSDLPAAKASAWASLKSQVASIVYSFTSDRYSVDTDDENVLMVWVSRSLTHVDLLQKMVDTGFTEETGIEVRISVMADATKLTLSAAAGTTPDVALGLSSYMPFDLASRGALYDLTQFDDFWEIANRFVAGAMVPYIYNEGAYAIPETLDFAAVIYRTDIFDSLGLTVPSTWEELTEMLPTLQRYGMNFYHNISSGVGYKWFYQTTPLIYQNGGSLYNSEGTATAIDSPESVAGLKALGDLFVTYSLDTQVNEFFNSFRYSVLPIGIVDSNSYILIRNGAPELEGQWELAPYLGTEQEDGSISRWYVANGTGGVIFDDSEMTEEAWEFLKWWTSEEVQVEYTYTLRSTYGDTYFWLPSNLDALEQAPIDQEDKQVILEMVEWLRDVPRTPGQYLVERSISDIWNAMVIDGTSAQVAADEKVIDINREITRKMQELGYYDEDGNQLKDYVIRDVDWIQEQMDAAVSGEEE